MPTDVIKACIFEEKKLNNEPGYPTMLGLGGRGGKRSASVLGKSSLHYY